MLSSGTGQQQSPARPPTEAGPVGLTFDNSSSRSSPSSEKPKSPADLTLNSFKRLPKAQKEPETPQSTADTGPSSSTDSFSSAESHTRPGKVKLRDLRKIQEIVALNQDTPPRFPEQDDFLGLSIHILERIIDVDVRNCVIILHERVETGPSLRSLALRLQRELPETVFILVQLSPTSSSNTKSRKYSSQRGAGDAEIYTEILRENRTILVNIIHRDLIGKCHFSPRNIVIFGHCEGGTAALGAAAFWKDMEFGGVISIGGDMPALTPDISTSKAKTPALILSGVLGKINDAALRRIKEYFNHVDFDIRRTSNDGVPEAEDIAILLDFFAHRLRGEEWTKQAVISFGRRLHHYSKALLTSS